MGGARSRDRVVSQDSTDLNRPEPADQWSSRAGWGEVPMGPGLTDMFRSGFWQWMHNSMTIIKATELYTVGGLQIRELYLSKAGTGEGQTGGGQVDSRYDLDRLRGLVVGRGPG